MAGLAAAAVAAGTTALAGPALASPALASPGMANPGDPGHLVVQTYENDTVGQVPTGCTTPGTDTPALVSNTMGYKSAQSMEISDPLTTKITVVDCAEPAQQGATLSWWAYPAALPNGYLISLLGDEKDISGTQDVFHLLVGHDGHIAWYDGSAWTQVTPAGMVPLGQWSHLELRVPPGQARGYIYVNGKYVASTGPWGVRAVTDITGYEFSSDGTTAAGDDVYVDDVGYGQDTSPAPAAATAPFRIGPAVPIDESSTVLEMPTAAVIVPHGRGKRILAEVPAHTDSSATDGNLLFYSDDMGKTWSPDQAANPMPDAPSFMMTRLRNGEILAVDYHGYMIAGSGDLKEEIDTAVSTDNGATWTNRAGVLTTPEPILPSTVTDRPGDPLGYVMVHSVVEDPDGTLYQSAYGQYQGDTKYRDLLLKSTDGGLNWTVQATVAYSATLSSSSAYQGFCEGAISRTADGRLLDVMRTGSYQPMYEAWSSDNGVTWTTPVPLLDGRSQLPAESVYPTLSLVGSRLVLLTGRPGLNLLMSPDGNGQAWTQSVAADYQNSANGFLLTIDSHHVMLFGDRGANWSVPTPETYEAWSRIITLPR